MPNSKNLFILLSLSFLFLSACGSQSKIDLTGKSELYKQGIHDGCATAEGDYTKNHDAFNNYPDYHEGWFHGRHYCEYNKRDTLDL